MVSVGSDFVAVIRGDGVVNVWGGSNTFGQLNVPLDLGLVTQISAGDGFILAVCEDGTVRGWGKNDCGQLNIPENLTGVLCVAAGKGYGYALKLDGTLVCWGENQDGQLFVPDDVQQKTVKAISCAGNKIAFISSDSSVTSIN